MTQVRAIPCELSISLPSRRDVERDLWNDQIQKAARLRSERVLNLLLDRPATDLSPETISALFKRHLKEPHLLLTYLRTVALEHPTAGVQIKGLVAAKALTVLQDFRLAVGYSQTSGALSALAQLNVLSRDEWLNLGTPTLRSTIEDIYVGAIRSKQALQFETGAVQRIDAVLAKLNSVVDIVTRLPLSSYLLDEASPSLARRVAEAKAVTVNQQYGQPPSDELVTWCFDHLGAWDAIRYRGEGAGTDRPFRDRLRIEVQASLKELEDLYDARSGGNGTIGNRAVRKLHLLQAALPLLGVEHGISQDAVILVARILRNEAINAAVVGSSPTRELNALIKGIQSLLPLPTTPKTQQAHLDLVIYEHLSQPSGLNHEHQLAARSLVSDEHEVFRSYRRDPQLTYPWGQLKLRTTLKTLLGIDTPLTVKDCYQCVEGVLFSSDQQGFVGTHRASDLLALGVTLTLMYPTQRATIWKAIEGSKLLQYFPTEVGVVLLRELGVPPFVSPQVPSKPDAGLYDIQALILRVVSKAIAGIRVSREKTVHWSLARETFGDQAVLQALIPLGLHDQIVTALNIEEVEDPSPAADGSVEFIRLNPSKTTALTVPPSQLTGADRLRFLEDTLEEIALRNSLSAHWSLMQLAKNGVEGEPCTLRPRYRVLAGAVLRDLIEDSNTSIEDLGSLELLLGQTLVLNQAQFEDIFLRHYRSFLNEISRTEDFEILQSPHSQTSNFRRITRLLSSRGFSLSETLASKLPDTPGLENVLRSFPDENLEKWITPAALGRHRRPEPEADLSSSVIPSDLSIARSRLRDADPGVRAATIEGLAAAAIGVFQNGAQYLAIKETLFAHYKRAAQEDHLPLSKAFVRMIEEGDIYLNGRLERDLERVLRDGRRTGALDWNHVAIRNVLHHGGPGLVKTLLTIAIDDKSSAKDRDTAARALIHSQVLERRLTLALTEQFLATSQMDTLETRAFLESCSWNSASHRATFLAELRSRGEVSVYRDPHGEDLYGRDELVPEGSPALELAMRRIADPDDRTAAVGFFGHAAVAYRQLLGAGEVEMLAHSLVKFLASEQREIFDAIRGGRIPTEEILFAVTTRRLLGPDISNRPLLDWRSRVQQFWMEYHQDGATPVDPTSPLGPSSGDLLALLRSMSILGNEFGSQTAIALQTATTEQIRQRETSDPQTLSSRPLFDGDYVIIPKESKGLQEKLYDLLRQVKDVTPKLLLDLSSQHHHPEVASLASRLTLNPEPTTELATISERAAALNHAQEIHRLERAMGIAEALLQAKTVRLGSPLREQLRQLIGQSALPRTAGSVLNLYQSLRSHGHRDIDRQVLISTQDLETALTRMQEEKVRRTLATSHHSHPVKFSEELDLDLRSNEAQRALCVITRSGTSERTDPAWYQSLADSLFRVLTITQSKSLKAELLRLGRTAAQAARDLTEQDYIVLCTRNPWIMLQLGDYPVRTCLATGSMPIRAMALRSQVQDRHIKALCVIPRMALGSSLDGKVGVHPIAPLTTEEHRRVLSSMIGRRIVKLVEGGSALFLEPLYAKPSLRQLADQTINTTLQPLSDAASVEITESGLEKLINVPASLSSHGQFEDRRREDGSVYPLCVVAGPYEVRVKTLRTPKANQSEFQDTEQRDR